MADDFQSGIRNGSWWNAARSGGFDATAMPMTAAPPISCSASGGSGEAFSWAATTAEPAGSASGSSITYQDNTPIMASNMDWNQALLSNGRAETSFHAMLHQDLSSTSPFFRQDPSMDLSMNPFKDMNQSLTNQHHLSSDVAPPVGLVPASSENYQPAIMGYQGIPTELPQPSSWPGFTQLIDASLPPMQQSRGQSQFSGSTPFWNSLGSAGSMESSGFYPLMATQFPPEPMEQKPSSSSSSNFKMKSSSQGARDSSSSTTKKNNVSEPAMKKPRIETPSPLPTFKVRKEKLGDRVTALQQLVSPFGKTDTASVLHETIDYIKFLHDQVKALSAPYLKNGHPMQHQQINPNESNNEEGPKQDLKSRGLCLVPVASTYPVASEIPADFWTPTFGGLFSCNIGRDESTFPKLLQEDLSSRAYFNQGTSMESDQINTSNQWSLVNSLKDIKQPFLDCGFKSYPVAQMLHGYPKIAMQDLFGVEA